MVALLLYPSQNTEDVRREQFVLPPNLKVEFIAARKWRQQSLQSERDECGARSLSETKSCDAPHIQFGSPHLSSASLEVLSQTCPDIYIPGYPNPHEADGKDQPLRHITVFSWPLLLRKVRVSLTFPQAQ